MPQRVLSSPGLETHQSRNGGGQVCRQHLTESLDVVPDSFFQLLHGWGRVGSKEKTFPKATVGWWRWEEETGFFSLLILADQATEHQGHHQGSPRTCPRPTLDGERQENSWSPVALASSLAGLATSVSMCGNVGGLWPPWKCWRAKWVGETRARLIPGSQDLCPTGPLGTGLAVLPLAPHGTGKLPGTDPETRWALFISSGPGRWRTLSGMARAWGLAAWGSG